VNADDDVIALEVELRQLLEAIELALEAKGRVLAGDRARGDLPRGEVARSHLFGWGAM